MKVKKENRVLTVDDADKGFYLAQGYDVVEYNEIVKKYEVVEEATGGKTYSVKEYQALMDENKELKKKIVELENGNEPDREAIKASLKELGIEFAGNTSTAKLHELLEATNKQAEEG